MKLLSMKKTLRYFDPIKRATAYFILESIEMIFSCRLRLKLEKAKKALLPL